MRLTQTLKNKIVKRAATVSPLQKLLAKRRAVLANEADKLRIAALGGPEMLEKIEAAWKHLTELHSQLDLNCINGTLHKDTFIRVDGLEGAGYAHWIYLPKDENEKIRPRVVPLERIDLAHYPKHQKPLQDAFDKYHATEEDLNDLRHQVRSVLDSVTTVKRLLDVWPEAADLLPDCAPKPSLPSVPIGDLNHLVGLPIKAAA